MVKAAGGLTRLQVGCSVLPIGFRCEKRWVGSWSFGAVCSAVYAGRLCLPLARLCSPCSQSRFSFVSSQRYPKSSLTFYDDAEPQRVGTILACPANQYYVHRTVRKRFPVAVPLNKDGVVGSCKSLPARPVSNFIRTFFLLYSRCHETTLPGFSSAFIVLILLVVH